jgi:predicted enzyme related to lactoylglutathione lyase
MHKSRLSSFVIDCQVDDLDAAARFWSAALGKPVDPPSPEDPNYRNIPTGAGEPILMLQKVDHESRIHLDIESDDVEAEAERLVALGAKKLKKIKTWWVMEAPSGQRFCVIRPQRGPIEGGNTWK